MIKLPYGNADFYDIITEGYYYADRTPYIPLIEDFGKALMFLRPRRFGKSLFVSTLRNYYDVNRAQEFDRLFGHLAIGQQPTPRHNAYFILNWNFSMVNTLGDMFAIQNSLFNHLNGAATNFFDRYHALLPRPITIYPSDGLATFQDLLSVIQSTPYKLYLLIDEYDNFANAVLMQQKPDSQSRYETLVSGEGLLKTLFKVVKGALEGMGLDRVFMTGVSPMVVNDMTSGFNMVKNITLAPDMHQLCGFHEDEVTSLLHDIADAKDFTERHVTEALEQMKTFYNGYSFLPSELPQLYNPTLTLYFLDHFQRQGRHPTDMLDENLSMDQAKIAYIASKPHGKAVVARAVNDHTPLTLTTFTNRLSVDDLLQTVQTDQFLITLLYYFGILTFSGTYNDRAEMVLTIPNLVTKQLYLDELREMILSNKLLQNVATDVVQEFYAKATIADLCAFIQDHYFSCFENRDYEWTNELTLKSIFLTLVQNGLYYSTFSEKPTIRGVADLVLLLKPDQRHHPLLEFLFEFKYLAPKKHLHMTGADLKAMAKPDAENLPQTLKAFAEAEAALLRYRSALYHQYGNSLRLRCFVVVALGYEHLLWREVVVGDEDDKE